MSKLDKISIVILIIYLSMIAFIVFYANADINTQKIEERKQIFYDIIQLRKGE